jgi:hypothetical protein
MKRRKKTYKANRATVAASYFAKSIEVVNKQSLCASFVLTFYFTFLSGDLKLFSVKFKFPLPTPPHRPLQLTAKCDEPDQVELEKKAERRRSLQRKAESENRRSDISKGLTRGKC